MLQAMDHPLLVRWHDRPADRAGRSFLCATLSAVLLVVFRKVFRMEDWAQ
jgi:hypothetical protein